MSRRFACQPHGLLVLVFGQRWPGRDAGKDIFFAERIDGGLQEKRAIDAAGIGNDHLAKRTEDLLQRVVFFFDTHKADGGT